MVHGGLRSAVPLTWRKMANSIRQPVASLAIPNGPVVEAMPPSEAAKALLEGEGYEVTPRGIRSVLKSVLWPWSRKGQQRSFTGFLKAVSDARVGTREQQYNAQILLDRTYKTGYQTTSSVITKTVMGEQSGTTGGYLVPMDFSLQLMETIVEDSFIYPRAQVIPMRSGVMWAPKVDVETLQSAGTNPLLGGVKFTWGSEQAPPETEPTFRQMELRSWDLLGLAKISNQFLMDTGPEGEGYLVKLFGRAAAWYAEYAFLQGTGTSKMMPTGIVNAPGTLSVTRSSSSHVTAIDIASMASSLLPFSWNRAVWATDPSTLADICKLSTFFVNQGMTDPGAAGYLLTRPLFVTDKLVPLGSTGDLILFDPWLYVIGSRLEVVVDVSPHADFQNFQTDFRVWLRLDGKPQVSKTITLTNGTTVVSPYVRLV